MVVPQVSARAVDNFDGGNVRAKWVHQQDADTTYTTRGWFGYTNVSSAYADADLYGVGAEFQLRHQFNDRTKIDGILGITHRRESLGDTRVIEYAKDVDDTVETAALGVELSHWITPDKLEAAAGFNATYDSYLVFKNLLPSAHVIYHLADKDRLWLSASQASKPITPASGKAKTLLLSVEVFESMAIQTPSGQIETDRQFNSGLRGMLLSEEELDAFEAGYRHDFGEKGALELNVFYYHYDQIFGSAQGSSAFVSAKEPYLLTQSVISNIAYGYSNGFELSAEWAFSPLLKAQFNYSFIEDCFKTSLMGDDSYSQSILEHSIDVIDNNVPKHQASLWLSTDFTSTLHGDLGLRYSSSFSHALGEQPEIFQADAKLSWKWTDTSSLSLRGRNLFDDSTSEGLLKDLLVIPTEIQREFSIEYLREF